MLVRFAATRAQIADNTLWPLMACIALYSVGITRRTKSTRATRLTC